jgi:transcriptional regulator with XRE-family HTH domain
MNISFCYNTKMEFDPTEFRDFIRDKFAEWRGKGRDTLVDFAAYIGVSQQLMSNWYNGNFKRPPTADSYKLLISKYGIEVYDVLGIPRPSEEDVLSALPPEYASAVKSALDEVRASGVNKGKEIASPEDIEKINAILEKHLGKYLVHGTEQ